MTGKSYLYDNNIKLTLLNDQFYNTRLLLFKLVSGIWESGSI